MKSLHEAAFIRAYRTLAQGLAASPVTAALIAVIAAATGGGAARAALGALGASLATAFVTALASFWQAVAKGLPEAKDE